MYRRHGDKLGLVFLACDLTVTVAAWLAAYVVRFACWEAPAGVPEPRQVLASLPGLCLAAAISFRAAGLYQIHRLQRLPSELGVIVRAAGLLFLLVVASIFYRRDLYESRLALGLFAALLPLGLVASRRALWLGLAQLRGRGLNRSRAIIVGSGRVARRLARVIAKHPWTGLRAVGFVDNDDGQRAALPTLGPIAGLSEIVHRHDVDHVFVALPLSRYGELPAVYEALSRSLVEVQLVPDLPSLAGMRIRSLEIERTCFLSLRENPHEGIHHLAKRGLDVAIASAALVLLSPLLGLIALLIRITSPGPALFRQPRTGLGGRSFQMLKFRSMRLDAEATSGPVWAKKHDPRCTPLGRFLRRWSLDELPQLFNVLAGDMSLVGPRPERHAFVMRFSKSLPGYCQRHRVKAGMTGWAQVNGWRGDTSIRRRLEHDLYYVANWSLWLDVKILWLTLFRGFRHKNAY